MILDIETGEFIKNRFAKMYLSDIGRLFDLTKGQMNLLMLMTKSIALGSQGHLNMTPKRKKEFARQLGLTTSNSISNMLRAMERVDVIKRTEPEEYPNRYTINPEIIFSGNDYQRVKLIIDYSGGKRRVKAFENEKAAAAWFQKEMEQEKLKHDGENNGN